MAAVMGGMEERAPNGFPDHQNAVGPMQFFNLTFINLDQWRPALPQNQTWAGWDHCSTAYVDYIWVPGPGYADFTDRAGPYSRGFTSMLEGVITSGGNPPAFYNGQFACGRTQW